MRDVTFYLSPIYLTLYIFYLFLSFLPWKGYGFLFKFEDDYYYLLLLLLLTTILIK